MDLGRVDNVQERRELKKALVTQVENEVDAVVRLSFLVGTRWPSGHFRL